MEMYLTTSWDDGSKYDLKLANLLYKYSIPATIYIAPKSRMHTVLSKKEIRELSSNFEIGGHTLHHKKLTSLPHSESRTEIVRGKEMLEEIIGKKVFSFAYPWGKYNQEIKQEVGLAGYLYARTTRTFVTKSVDRLLSHTTLHACNHQPLRYLAHQHGGIGRKLHFELLRSGRLYSSWDKIAEFCLNYCLKKRGVFHLYGHSWEIEKNDDWQRLEKVFAYINKNTKTSQRFSNCELSEKIEEDKKTYYANYDPFLHDKGHQTSYYRAELKKLKNLIGASDQAGVKVLDIGCGTGRVASLFLKADYTGIDYSKNFIKYAQRRYQRINRRFINYDFKNHIDLDLGKQDLIIMWGFLNDTPNPLAELLKIKRLVRRGTKIVFTLQNASNPFYRAVKYLRSEFFDQPYLLTSFTKKFIQDELKRFCRQYNYYFEISSLGLVTPSSKFIPYIPAGSFGHTLVLILKKL